jgi:hypothetical protein
MPAESRPADVTLGPARSASADFVDRPPVIDAQIAIMSRISGSGDQPSMGGGVAAPSPGEG